MFSAPKFPLFISLLLTAGLSACSSAPTPEEKRAAVGAPPADASIEAKQVAAEREASDVTEVGFSKGQSRLNVIAKNKLKKVMAEAKKHGEIEEVNVIVWADREYPSVHTEKLSSEQVKLAKARGEEIEKFLESLDGSPDVKFYSMAERPSAFSDWFNTSGARVKKSLEVAGIPNTDTSVKAPSKASKAIVMVLLKE